MAEQLYTIPVNEAFSIDCECPLCKMEETLQKSAIEFTLGPSYMEDDVRMETNRIGFCEKHVKLLYEEQNRLGLALMLLTHMEDIIANIEEKQKAGRKTSGRLFKKQTEESELSIYGKSLSDSCYICARVERLFERYLATIFYLYKKETSFRELFSSSKGFCIRHYLLLHQESKNNLKGKELDDFTEQLNQIFLLNFKRVKEDLAWYVDKFDYRNADAPWKNSKDAISRSMLKLNSITEMKI